MAQSRKVFGLGVDAWTNLIACVQIMYSLMVSLFMSVHFMYAILITTQGGSLFNVRLSDVEIAVRLLFLIIFGISGVVMGLVLFKGSDERDPKYLRGWIMYTYISFIIVILKYLALIVFNFNFQIIFTLIFAILATFELMVTLFMVRMVVMFEKEIVVEKFMTAGQVSNRKV